MCILNGFTFYKNRRRIMALHKTYSKDKTKCGVTFELSAEAAKDAEQVWLAGDFNSWSSADTPMKKQKNGSFKVKVTLEAGHEYQFRYLLDGKRWEMTGQQTNMSRHHFLIQIIQSLSSNYLLSPLV